jgi:hypothetical protein
MNIELCYAIIDTAELILVGECMICTIQQFTVLLQKYGCILNTQQQTLKQYTIHNAWSDYVGPSGTNLCMGRGRSLSCDFIYITTK